MLDPVVIPETVSNGLFLDPTSDNPFFDGYQPFAINVGGIVTANGGLDTEGIPTDLSDDARIFTKDGFDFNGQNLVLPVVKDSNRDGLLDPQGKLTLLEDAVVVGPNFQLAEATIDLYNNLLPPQIGEDIAVNYPLTANAASTFEFRKPTGLPSPSFESTSFTVPNNKVFDDINELELQLVNTLRTLLLSASGDFKVRKVN